MKKLKKKILYESIMCILAVISVAFAVIDMRGSPPRWMIISDSVIYVIFLADYSIRLILSKSKLDFIKSNVPDLISIIPFSSALRIFRMAKLVKLTRLAKLTKLAKFSKLTVLLIRLYDHCKVFLNTNGFKNVLILTGASVMIGGYAIHIAEDMSFSDGLWWAFVTATTVGYGDISPSSGAGRVIAMLLMLVGIGLIGSLTSTITSFFLNTKEKTGAKDKTVEIIKDKLDDIDSLDNNEIDDICRIIESFKK